MSTSQLRRIETYTETRMAESLRQACDYRQDQPGLTLTYAIEIGITAAASARPALQSILAKGSEADRSET